MRAGTKDDVFVALEWDKKVFGKVSGKSGVHWEDMNEQSGGN